MNVLETIVSSRREASSRIDRVAARLGATAAAEGGPRHRFAAALQRPGAPHIIAEVKAASPSAGRIRNRIDPAALSREYRRAGACAISVVVEPEFFGGSLKWVNTAKETGLPVLVKDFILEEAQVDEAVAAGADAVLLIAAIVDRHQLGKLIRHLKSLGRDALVEVHDEDQLSAAVDEGVEIVGVNNRDLRTFAVDLQISEGLGRLIPPGLLRVSESGIRTRSDVERLGDAGFNACLVGESILRDDHPGAAVRRLLGRDSEGL